MMNSRRICPADGSQYKQSAVGLVFMESAAGLAMETSKVESAVRNQAKAKLNQLEHSHSAGRLCVDNQSQDPVASYSGSSQLGIQSQESRCSGELHPDARFQSQYSKISAEDEFSRSDLSAAKQLTIYESWMSTAELNSNGENDKKPAKEKDASTISLSVLYRTHLNGKNFVSNGIISNRAYILQEAPLKIDCWLERTRALLLKLIAQCTNRGKMKRKTKQSTAIREKLSRESIAESRLAC
ncbi:ABC transporter, subfamily B, ATP-binding & transmembrane domain isoform 1 [Dorcoceras hygrometricum]|uniref:ABC transporter, subfamily B, ATP-binding & transmembrane domain isoform 1 n=1 Tax=Dorcoceras hygrometricum TaxID=472368 RepID=A0A2Z7C4T1_9LAMI|nr:ABC transporter, subfamily B, ATP-binding & transmembrane domain isoform 1 [Dorcoceras hygrometricum]